MLQVNKPGQLSLSSLQAAYGCLVISQSQWAYGL